MTIPRMALVVFVGAGILILIAKLTAQSPNCSSPQWPCALHQTNSQLTTVALPSPLPFSGLTGANTCWKTPYGTTVCRCTDVNTSTLSNINQSYEVSDSGGASEQAWNANGTMLRIILAGEGTTVVMQVDPVAKRCIGLLPNTEVAAGSVWDAADSDKDYILIGTVISSRTGFHNAQGPTASQLVDLAQACPFNPPLSKPAWSAQLSTDASGTNLVTAFSGGGGQNTGIYVVAYNLAKGGCQVLNTQTGQFTAKGYGNAGPAKGTNGFFPFTVHDSTLYSGAWAGVSIGTCPTCPAEHGMYLWQVGTTTMNLTTVNASGHETMGFGTWVNLTNSPAMAMRPATAVNSYTMMSSATGVKFPFPQETHCGWRNADWNETRPPICSQVSQNEQMPIVTKTPLQQEVYGVDPKTGTYIRLAPTFTSGIANTFNFRTQNAIVVVAPKDAPPAVAWSSDMMGTMGNTDGKSSACILGAIKPNECRSDVFIVFP